MGARRSSTGVVALFNTALSVWEAHHRAIARWVVGASRQPRTVLGERPDGRLPEGVVTFLLNDVEGSSRLWEADPATGGTFAPAFDDYRVKTSRQT